MNDTMVCSVYDQNLMHLGLDTARKMLDDIRCGQPGVDPALKLVGGEPFLEAQIAWLKDALNTYHTIDGDGPVALCESIDEALAQPAPPKVPCTPAEYGILIQRVSSEKRKLAHTQEAKPGSAIHEYAQHIPDHIAYTERILAIYFPVEGYRHPDGLTVCSVGRGGE